MQHESEKIYKEILESIDEGFCIVKVLLDKNKSPIDYRFLETNRAFNKHSKLENVLGKCVREVLPDLEEPWFEIFGNIVRTGEPTRFERYSKSVESWFSVYAFCIGKPQDHKIAVLFTDITERKNAQMQREKLLRKVDHERKILNDIFQKAPSFMCILRGPDHIFERVNELYYQLVNKQDILGKPVNEALPETEAQGFINLLDHVYHTGKTFKGNEMPIMLHRQPEKKLAEKHYLDFVYQPLRNPDGTIDGIFVQGVDQTERKQAREDLQAINKTLEERVEERTEALLAYQEKLRALVSRLSKAEENERQRLAAELHDQLGQTLTIGKMKLDQLQNPAPGQSLSEIKELAELMDTAILHTRKLMLDLKPPPSINQVNLKETMAWIANRMKKNGLEVTIEDDGQLKPLREGVLTVLRQCVRELLFNVAEHAHTQSARISLARKEEQVQIMVEDKGAGFNPDLDKMAFEGKGFGLFNILERIDLLGGNFEINSEPGKGTRAVITVPMESNEDMLNASNTTAPPQEETKTSEAEQLSKTGSGSKIRVLLADDHQMMRKGLRKIIEEEEDLEVIAEASDGEEAVKLTQQATPDVIVMDVNMPGMDGIQATRQITSNNGNIRIIGLSLHDTNNVARSMKEAGASAYLTKTEAIEELVKTIRREAGAK